MAKKVKHDKFLILELNKEEMIKIGSYCLCDWCDNRMPETGYYIAVLNCIYCPKCFKEWKKRARYYPEDREVEQRNYNYYTSLLDE